MYLCIYRGHKFGLLKKKILNGEQRHLFVHPCAFECCTILWSQLIVDCTRY